VSTCLGRILSAGYGIRLGNTVGSCAPDPRLSPFLRKIHLLRECVNEAARVAIGRVLEIGPPTPAENRAGVRVGRDAGKGAQIRDHDR
jgi:hypothetical protein